MATRCGCTGTSCSCFVRAGANTTVTGAGSQANPYVISADTATLIEADTTTVNMHVTGGPAYVVSADVIISPDAGNIIVANANGLFAPGPCVSTDAGNEIVLGTDGCLYAPTPTPAVPVTVTDTPTVDLTLTGQNIAGDVIVSPDAGNVLVAHPNGLFVPTTVFTNGNGIAPIVGGVITACLSTDANNALSFGTDGCLFTPSSAGTPVTVVALDTNSINTTVAGGPNYTVSSDVIRDPSAQNLLSIGAAGVLVDVVTGCGLSGIGTAASPLIVPANAWPFACAEANGVDVYCDPATGMLVTAPEKFAIDVYVKRITVAGTQDVATLVPGPYPKPNTLIGPTFTLTVTNPSPCLPMRFTLWGGFAHFNMRMNNPGRGNVLTSISITGGAGATLVVAGDQFHEQWMRDQASAEADNTFDTQGTIVDGIYTLPAATSATFTAQAQLQITNYDAGMVITLSDLELSMHAMGSN